MDSGRSETGVSTLRDLIIFAQHPLQFGQLRLPPSEFDRRGRRIESNNGTGDLRCRSGPFRHASGSGCTSFLRYDTLFFMAVCFLVINSVFILWTAFVPSRFVLSCRLLADNAHTTQGHGGPDEHRIEQKPGQRMRARQRRQARRSGCR